MNSYRILFKNRSFITLPPTIQSDKDAILFAARHMRVKLGRRRELDRERFVVQFTRRGGLAICCNEEAFFPPEAAVAKIATPREEEVERCERQRAEKKRAVHVQRQLRFRGIIVNLASPVPKKSPESARDVATAAG
jgi:hypothetical protein